MRVVSSPSAGAGGQPLQRIPGIVAGGGELPFRRQAVVQRHHGAARLVGQAAAQLVVRVDAAHGKAAAVQIQQHRRRPALALAYTLCLRLRLGRIQARGQQGAVAGGNLQLLHPRQRDLGDFQHAGTGLIGRAGLLGRELVHMRAVGPCHAAQHIAHRGGQGVLGQEVGGVVHGGQGSQARAAPPLAAARPP
jgi:hypothetical protein